MPSIAALGKATEGVEGGSQSEGSHTYKYLRGTVQPTVAPAFRLGEALSPSDDDLNPQGEVIASSDDQFDRNVFRHQEMCGLLFVPVSGRLKEFVLMIAEIYRLHPELRETLMGIVEAMDFVSDPIEYHKQAIPIASKEARRVISRCCHKLLRDKKALKVLSEDSSAFGSALHAATNRHVSLDDRRKATQFALLVALAGSSLPPYNPSEEEVKAYYASLDDEAE